MAAKQRERLCSAAIVRALAAFYASGDAATPTGRSLIMLARPSTRDDFRVTTLPSGQFAFRFLCTHLEALERKRTERRAQRAKERAEQRRQKRGEIGKLLELAELPESYLTVSELARLDEYMHKSCQEIQAGWTATREAEARGVDVRSCAQVFNYDGRLFQCDNSVQLVLLSDLNEIANGMLDAGDAMR